MVSNEYATLEVMGHYIAFPYVWIEPIRFGSVGSFANSQVPPPPTADNTGALWLV